MFWCRPCNVRDPSKLRCSTRTCASLFCVEVCLLLRTLHAQGRRRCGHRKVAWQAAFPSRSRSTRKNTSVCSCATYKRTRPHVHVRIGTHVAGRKGRCGSCVGSILLPCHVLSAHQQRYPRIRPCALQFLAWTPTSPRVDAFHSSAPAAPFLAPVFFIFTSSFFFFIINIIICSISFCIIFIFIIFTLVIFIGITFFIITVIFIIIVFLSFIICSFFIFLFIICFVFIILLL